MYDENGVNIGRPPYEPNDKDEAALRALIAAGVHQTIIELTIKKDIDTLKKYYPEAFTTKVIDRNNMVKDSLYKKALVDGDTTALIWITKTQMRWHGVKDAPSEQEVDSNKEFAQQIAEAINANKKPTE